MDTFWPSCLDRFQRELTPQQFNTWIRPLRAETEGETVRVVAPNRFVLNWIKDKFLSRIEELAAQHFGSPRDVQLVAVESSLESIPPPRVPAAETPSQSPDMPAARTPGNRLNPAFTFESFVTGKANHLAHAAALQVAENPGTAYNPFFIYGGVGLGKTHLVQAIGNFILARRPDARLRYIHAEQYVSDVVRAYQHKAFHELKRYYQSLDALLIDDIQFFNGKNRTQEEFFYTFNALIESHRQVIISSDTYPKEMSGIEDRLISRFGWGLTVELEPPELEMRVAILLRKAHEASIALPQEIAFFLANLIHSNVRELEGALKRILAYVRFSGRPLSLELAKEALKDLVALQQRQITVENIQRTVADYYKIKVAEMYSKKRSRVVARPRQVAMALAKELTQLSLPDIGDAFGGRDHTTVLHACRKIKELRSTHADISRDWLLLQQMLRN